MSNERPCGLCRVLTDVDFMVNVDNFPLAHVCEPCSVQLHEDDEDPHAGERECPCGSHCADCTPGIGRWL